MPLPQGIRAIDLMINIPTDEHNTAGYSIYRTMQRDAESLDGFQMPAQYMFKNIPSLGADPTKFVDAVVAEMDKHGIEQALIPLGDTLRHPEIKARYADRFIFQTAIDPNKGMEEVRRIRQAHKEHGIKAISYFPAASLPQVGIGDRELFPFYATAIDLDIPILVNAGVPGPRMPMRTQHVELIDEVCWYFPELKFVMRHGAEPWADLAVKLMLKYPNLYYSTSGFAPKYYPKAIIDYMNTRGADKVLYAGYFPAGLSLDRIFADLDKLPIKDEVWPKFLRGNAERVFKL
ncbi:MAG: amidohydrolase [Sphingomonadales bacterium]|nr:MAG: amidohydrolase [Sphingomonadales bacterium]